MRILFAADAHLAAAFPRATARFFSFLDNDARGADALYLLGDIFHLWLGDDIGDGGGGDIGGQFAAAIRRLRDGGVAVYFQRGNHDFLVGDSFAARAGMRIIPDEFALAAGARRLLLMHGDTLCALDKDYQRFRAQVRAPRNIAAFLELPPEARRARAKSLMVETAAAAAAKPPEMMTIPNDAALDALARNNCDTLIHGHTHRPKQIPLSPPARERIVLPDWPLHAAGGYAEYDGEEIYLRLFPAE